MHCEDLRSPVIYKAIAVDADGVAEGRDGVVWLVLQWMSLPEDLRIFSGVSEPAASC